MRDFELHDNGAQDSREPDNGERGFALIGMVVAIFLVLLLLGMAAPKIAQDLKRDREVEAMHRGNQYVRAVQLYYRKLGHYPGSVEQLEKTNNIRFLRQKYVDPMTGKADWRLIHVGEAKTTVKGFFGEPLAGIASQGLGSAAGNASTGMGGQSTVAGASSGSAFGSSSFGSSSGSSFGGVGSRPGFGSTSSGAAGTSAGTGAAGGGTGTGGGTGNGTGSSSGTGGANGSSDQSSSSSPSSPLTGGGGLIVGVGSSATGGSILDLNEQTTYETWEFIYDPRIELLKAKASLFGGGASANAGSLGSAQGNQSTFGNGTAPTTTPGTNGSAPGGAGPGTTIGVPVQP